MAVFDKPQAVRRAAMDLLAMREHGRVELSRKLAKRGAPSEWVDIELERLSEQGLLNEDRYLESFIASKARAGYGPSRIREQLSQRGLAREAINEAIGNAEIDWAAQLYSVWQRKFGRPPQDAREYGQQARFLAYRGYSSSEITRLLKSGVVDES